MCERHISYIFCACVRAACVRDRLCERAQDSYSMHVRGSMRGRQKEGGKLKCCWQEPPLQGQMASTAQPGPAAGRSSLVSPQTPGVWEMGASCSFPAPTGLEHIICPAPVASAEMIACHPLGSVLFPRQIALLIRMRLGIIARGIQDVEGQSFGAKLRNLSHLSLLFTVASRKMILTFSFA